MVAARRWWHGAVAGVGAEVVGMLASQICHMKVMGEEPA
jgi:predicted benzoate:H+ symporter BenE